MPTAIPLCPLILVAALALIPPQEKGPSLKEQEAWVQAYLELDRRSAPGRTEAPRLLSELERAGEPTPADLSAWRKRIARLQRKLRPLEQKSGRHLWWEEESRGLYIVGGEEKRPKGLFIGLHGGGAGSGEAESAASSFAPAASRLDWLGIFPEVLEKTEHGWTDSGTEEWVLDLIDSALRTWDIDSDRVWIGGHSMGGYGTWVIGAHHADLFAGLCASAGAPTPVMDSSGAVTGIMEGVVPNLRNVPMVVWQSLDDPQVPPAANQAAAREVERAKGRWGGFERFLYWEVDGFGHGLPNKGAIELLEKVSEEKRDPHPERIVWQPALPWKQQFYWLWWDEPRQGAIVEARLDRKANTIDVTVEGEARGLCVLLGPELVDMQREVTLRLGEQVVYQGLPRRQLASFVMTAAGGDPGRTYEARVPLVP